MQRIPLTISSLAASALMAACAAPVPAPATQQPAAAAGQPQQEEVCEKVYKVGVAIPVKQCTKVPLNDDERRRMQDEFRNTTRPGGTPPGN